MALDPSAPLSARSALGHLLPESLIAIAHGRGPSALAAALVADTDHPELIWTHRMRFDRLIPQARCAPFVLHFPIRQTLSFEHTLSGKNPLRD